MKTLPDYARAIGRKAGLNITSGEVFAKILAHNDNASRHGVVVPTDVYSFFPNLNIRNRFRNATRLFDAFDVRSDSWVKLAYKYYQRYPERRITRVNRLVNDVKRRRLLIIVSTIADDGKPVYVLDIAVRGKDEHFGALEQMIFGKTLRKRPNTFLRSELSAARLAPDRALRELLQRFDAIRRRGWIRSKRVGDTGIGFTFESLLGIKENNAKLADYKGIEIKCSLKGERGSSGKKINLFQEAPSWRRTMTSLERLRLLGHCDANGIHRCHSQVTTTPNNLGMKLTILPSKRTIELKKRLMTLGDWKYDVLAKRLHEKHSRAVFVTAQARGAARKRQYKYEQLTYCARPKIDQFLSMVGAKQIVFEFLMSQQPDGSVRNHGYPWRLKHAVLLEHLFSFQAKLR